MNTWNRIWNGNSSNANSTTGTTNCNHVRSNYMRRYNNGYADNNNLNDQYNNSYNNNNLYNNQYQSQKQSFVNNQIQQTAQTQTFIEQVDDTVACISLAGNVFENKQDEGTVNLLCDAAVVSLNMFAVSCEQLHKEDNKDALDLGRKQVKDKLRDLQKNSPAVYKLIAPHRNFINAALNGEKNLRYNEDRTEPGSKKLFEQDPAEIVKAYGKMIHHQQKYNKSRDALLEEKTNKQLAKQHKLQLNEYRNNTQKYRNKFNKNKSGSKNNYARSQIKDFYFTQSGKSATFVNKDAEEKVNKEKKAMDEDIFGSQDVYNDILPRKYMNAALKFSKKNKWKNIAKPLPCLIIPPNENERLNQDQNKIEVRPCYPYNNRTYMVPVSLLELNVENIKKIENKYIHQLQKNCMENLGYPSIEDKESEVPGIIGYADEGSDDHEMDDNNEDSDSNL